MMAVNYAHAHAHYLQRAWNMLATCTTKADISSDSAESTEHHKLDMREVLMIAGIWSLACQLLLQGALAASKLCYINYCSTPITWLSINCNVDTGDVRLVNNILNSTECEGLLEVKFKKRFINGWFAVCDSSFGQEEIQVVCRQLGCNNGNGYRTHILRYVDNQLVVLYAM